MLVYTTIKFYTKLDKFYLKIDNLSRTKVESYPKVIFIKIVHIDTTIYIRKIDTEDDFW